MNWNQYQYAAMRTNADQTDILHRLWKLGSEAMQLDNAARGLSDECGEISSNVKKYIEYQQPLDRANLKEEVGDCLWRLAQICDSVNLTLEECAEGNIAKLAKRYPAEFSDELAKEENRDRVLESRAMDGSTLSEAVRIGEIYAAACNETDPPNKPEGEGWEFGSPGLSGEDIEYAFKDNPELGITVYRSSRLEVPWGVETWWRVKPTECQCPIIIQNGNGFGEPPEEEDVSTGRESSYTRSCTKCGGAVHKTNQTDPLRCADCYKPNQVC